MEEKKKDKWERSAVEAFQMWRHLAKRCFGIALTTPLSIELLPSWDRNPQSWCGKMAANERKLKPAAVICGREMNLLRLQDRRRVYPGENGVACRGVRSRRYRSARDAFCFMAISRSGILHPKGLPRSFVG